MNPPFCELSLGAQTSYAELLDIARTVAETRFSLLRGSFHKRQIKNKTYVYFNFRDTDGRVRSAYVGPDGERVRRLITDVDQGRGASSLETLTLRSRACMALGCSGIADKHFRIIQKLASYGIFKARGVLTGAHAFAVMGNMLGVRWRSGATAMNVDVARAGHTIAVALTTDAGIEAHDTISSLEMGYLPIREFSGKTADQYRNLDSPALRMKLITPADNGAQAAAIPGLGFELEPAPFTSFLLENTAQGVAFAKSGACLVNLPDPARFTVHCLLECGERLQAGRADSLEHLPQADALLEWHMDQQRVSLLQKAWWTALAQGTHWRLSAEHGRAALESRSPAAARLLK